VEKNIEAAAALGFHAIHFKDPASLRESLVRLGVFDVLAKDAIIE
jgi:hypothetical protein